MSNPTLLVIVSAAVLVGGFVAGAIARYLLAMRRPPRLGWAASTLCGMVGAVAGASGAAFALGRPVRDAPVPVVLAGIAGTLVVLLAADAVARRREPVRPTLDDLLREGESAHVEFKSTARHNTHTGTRDARLELVIATTVAGFFNARGGALLIGVDDSGTIVGLDDDYRLMRRPDRDSYELWLRDLFETTLGTTAAQAVHVQFRSVDGADVCIVDVPAAPSPVYLRPGRQARTELVVRVGNSTRTFDARDTVEYAARRWPRQARRRPVGRRPAGTDLGIVPGDMPLAEPRS